MNNSSDIRSSQKIISSAVNDVKKGENQACDQGGGSPLDPSTSGSPWQAGCPTIRKITIFDFKFPIFNITNRKNYSLWVLFG
jgi:hypothetical protein